MALLLSSAHLGCSDFSRCGFNPSPSDGRGCGGRCEYIPVGFGLGIHASHARRTPCHPKATHIVRNRGRKGLFTKFRPTIHGATIVVSSISSLDIHVEPFGPYPRIREKTLPPKKPFAVRNPMQQISISVLNLFEVCDFNQTHHVSRCREAVGAAGVRGRTPSPKPTGMYSRRPPHPLPPGSDGSKPLPPKGH